MMSTQINQALSAEIAFLLGLLPPVCLKALLEVRRRGPEAFEKAKPIIKRNAQISLNLIGKTDETTSMLDALIALEWGAQEFLEGEKDQVEKGQA